MKLPEWITEVSVGPLKGFSIDLTHEEPTAAIAWAVDNYPDLPLETIQEKVASSVMTAIMIALAMGTDVSFGDSEGGLVEYLKKAKATKEFEPHELN